MPQHFIMISKFFIYYCSCTNQSFLYSLNLSFLFARRLLGDSGTMKTLLLNSTAITTVNLFAKHFLVVIVLTILKSAFKGKKRAYSKSKVLFNEFANFCSSI